METISDQIRSLEVGQKLVLRGAVLSSVKSIASRIRKQYKKKREFTTRNGNGAVTVWRLM